MPRRMMVQGALTAASLPLGAEERVADPPRSNLRNHVGAIEDVKLAHPAGSTGGNGEAAILFALNVEAVSTPPTRIHGLELLIVLDAGAILPDGPGRAFGDAQIRLVQPTPGVGCDDLRKGLDESGLCIVFGQWLRSDLLHVHAGTGHHRLVGEHVEEASFWTQPREDLGVRTCDGSAAILALAELPPQARLFRSESDGYRPHLLQVRLQSVEIYHGLVAASCSHPGLVVAVGVRVHLRLKPIVQ
mmetsp:Transcript_151499/g.385115  ORF Transcript_151499/g.385115 Transcript_151499/m.385115 type:complete len:245 (-) Transcript_151499:1112-1846(-)